MRRLLTNPVAQFLAAGFVVLLVVVLGSVHLGRQAAEREAIHDASATTQLLARSVVEPAVPRGLLTGDPGAVDRFDRVMRRRNPGGDLKRIKVWRADGRIVYSDESRLIGSRYPLGTDEREALDRGVTEAEVSDLSKPENRFDRGMGGLLEVYTRIATPEGPPLLFEAYYSSADIATRRSEVAAGFRPIALGGIAVLVAFTTPLLWVLTRRLDRIARDRERLLVASAGASEAERRRIARDLHDGVVQDLAGTSFALAAAVRDPTTDDRTAARLRPMSDSLRRSLRSLRSLLVEIYPAELDAAGLAAAVDDLVAPAAGAGVSVSVDVRGVDGASVESVRLVWRVAQEAVRNALRHADASRLDVLVQDHHGRLSLVVTDDGRGFSHEPAGDGLGLRCMRDLIREAGGTLHVDSRPEQGTTVSLEVAR
ncbi:MAG: ATP-binding protein [Nocardioidaceae bacterium]